MLFEVSQRIQQDLFHSQGERTGRPVGQALGDDEHLAPWPGLDLATVPSTKRDVHGSGQSFERQVHGSLSPP